jgi:hypothetical protein
MVMLSILTDTKTPRYAYYENIPVGDTIEIEGLQKYIFKIENEKKVDKPKLTIEDNRYTLRFDTPRRNRNNNHLVQAAAEKGMLARRQELTVELPAQQSKEHEPTAIKVRALKGQK